MAAAVKHIELAVVEDADRKAKEEALPDEENDQDQDQEQPRPSINRHAAGDAEQGALFVKKSELARFESANTVKGRLPDSRANVALDALGYMTSW